MTSAALTSRHRAAPAAMEERALARSTLMFRVLLELGEEVIWSF